MISVLEDVLEDFSVYLRVEKRVSEAVAKNYCYTVAKFLRWVDTINPERKDAVKYYDTLLRERKKASSIRNILAALKHYFEFNGKELDLKPPVVDDTCRTCKYGKRVTWCIYSIREYPGDL